jgi:hypothetical protein
MGAFMVSYLTNLAFMVIIPMVLGTDSAPSLIPTVGPPMTKFLTFITLSILRNKGLGPT